jgi:hypothetical protein
MWRSGGPSRNTVKTALGLTVLAAAAAVAPIRSSWIESAYSAGFYPALQTPITSASNRVPFALFDALVFILAALWTMTLVCDVRQGGRWNAALAVAMRTVTIGAVVYLAFLVLWGFNYRRVPLAETLQIDRTAISRDAVRRVHGVSIERLNGLAVQAHQLGWHPVAEIDPALRDGLSRTVHDLGLAMPIVATPKRTLLDWYFRRAGVEGMTDPFFLETLVVSDLLPFERPMVVAHEWSHLAGLADESAANFAGWLACIHGSPSDQYSGWLFLYEELGAVLPRAEREAVSMGLGATPRADLAAARARILRNVQPRVSAVAWRAYDSYLKSNRIEAGTRSYGEVVQLVLGTRFADDWTPVIPRQHGQP